MSVLIPPQEDVALPEAAVVAPKRLKTVVLAGNPNVGKSVVFNALTGLYANVSNFPGTTVDIPSGKTETGLIVKDSPGIYGLSRLSEEEEVAEKAILSGDLVINVVSATSLARDLFLTLQLIDYGLPMLVVVNQMDEAQAAQLELDLVQLSTLLGVPVIPTVATADIGLSSVRDAIALAETAMNQGDVTQLMGRPTPGAPSPEGVKLLESTMGDRMKLYGLRRQHVNALISHVVRQYGETPSVLQRVSQSIGRALLNPVIGLSVGLLVMLALYQIVGIWVAGDLVDLIEGQVMLAFVIPWMQGVVGLLVPSQSPLFEVLAGEFGVLTMSVQYIFGVLFPLVLGFYVYISILEDCGYLPRIAVLLDGLLNKIGLNGRAVIPIILGFGCVTMATVSTRVLTSQRERTIASTILAITIPCSAQLGVIVGLMAKAGGIKAWGVYTGLLMLILIGLGTLLNKLLPGKSTSLVLDLPPMRLPSFKNLARKTWVRTVIFLKEAAPLFMLGSLLVSVAQVTGFLASLEAWLSPVTKSLLHLPLETARAFIMGMVRRDFGAAGLYLMADQMRPIQMLTCLVVITLFVPCIASATVMWKERGLKESAIVLVGSWVLAFAIGAVVTRFLEAVPIL